MRKIDLIVVHCAYTTPGMDIGANEIRRWHIDDRGWSDIGYHYVIRRDGRVEEGRPIRRQGAHARGHNKNSLGICLVGGKDDNGSPDCNYTAAQWKSLHTLVSQLEAEYPGADVVGHRDLTNRKACPVFDVGAWWGTTQRSDP